MINNKCMTFEYKEVKLSIDNNWNARHNIKRKG